MALNKPSRGFRRIVSRLFSKAADSSATSSILHRLPTEIRWKIWEELYPRQVVHIHDPMFRVKAQYCEANNPEEDAYDNWRAQQTADSESEFEGWGAKQHIMCPLVQRGMQKDRYRPRRRLSPDLRPLRICKAFSQEIEETIYRNHIFGFEDGERFYDFLTERTEYQISQIRALMLSFTDMARSVGRRWEENIQMHALRRLTGLRKLHVYVSWPNGLFCVVERFQVCPLEVVTVLPTTFYRTEQDVLDECEKLRHILLEEWVDGETSSERLAELEIRIRREVVYSKNRLMAAAAVAYVGGTPRSWLDN